MGKMGDSQLCGLWEIVPSLWSGAASPPDKGDPVEH